jgi:PIN domain nuclease of toxin-antitoxin system
LRLLLDTHVALWAITDDARLPANIRDLIADAQNSVQVSAASIWEIAIKHGLARGSRNDMPISGAEAAHFFRASGYGLLAISADHAAAVEALPPLHSDPFDRLLVAQALTEPLKLITHDAKVAAYSEAIVRF